MPNWTIRSAPKTSSAANTRPRHVSLQPVCNAASPQKAGGASAPPHPGSCIRRMFSTRSETNPILRAWEGFARLGRHPERDHLWWNVANNDRLGANPTMAADDTAGHDHGALADPNIFVNDNRRAIGLLAGVNGMKRGVKNDHAIAKRRVIAQGDAVGGGDVDTAVEKASFPKFKRATLQNNDEGAEGAAGAGNQRPGQPRIQTRGRPRTATERAQRTVSQRPAISRQRRSSKPRHRNRPPQRSIRQTSRCPGGIAISKWIQAASMASLFRGSRAKLAQALLGIVSRPPAFDDKSPALLHFSSVAHFPSSDPFGIQRPGRLQQAAQMPFEREIAVAQARRGWFFMKPVMHHISRADTLATTGASQPERSSRIGSG